MVSIVPVVAVKRFREVQSACGLIKRLYVVRSTCGRCKEVVCAPE